MLDRPRLNKCINTRARFTHWLACLACCKRRCIFGNHEQHLHRRQTSPNLVSAAVIEACATLKSPLSKCACPSSEYVSALFLKIHQNVLLAHVRRCGLMLVLIGQHVPAPACSAHARPPGCARRLPIGDNLLGHRTHDRYDACFHSFRWNLSKEHFKGFHQHTWHAAMARLGSLRMSRSCQTHCVRSMHNRCGVSREL